MVSESEAMQKPESNKVTNSKGSFIGVRIVGSKIAADFMASS
jgi:hypothetical protein